MTNEEQTKSSPSEFSVPTMSSPEVDRLSIRVITWNVASTYPERDLHALLGIEKPVQPSKLPDIYAVGLQEVNVRPLNVLNQVIFEEPWVTNIRLELRSFGYIKLCSYQLQGLLLMIFVKRDHIFSYRDITPSCTRTGLGGVWGNKGATVISLKAFGTSVCFVNSHLAAHDHEYKRRTQEYKDIVGSQTFPGSSSDILSHDYSFWFGDLNFRLNDVTMDQLKNAIRNDAIMPMLKHDQLTTARQNGDAFSEFKEDEITFRPTFKFQLGTAHYKFNARKPAWTDRILYRCRHPNEQLELNSQEYTSNEDILQSDHRPVSCSFQITVVAQPSATTDRVYFYEIGDWTVNRGFEFWFCTDVNMGLISTDWIGLFPEDFSATDAYVGYVWVDTQPTDRRPTGDEVTDLPGRRRTYRQTFCDQMLVLPGNYVLVYFRGKCDVLGVSSPFKIHDGPALR